MVPYTINVINRRQSLKQKIQFRKALFIRCNDIVVRPFLGKWLGMIFLRTCNGEPSKVTRNILSTFFSFSSSVIKNVVKQTPNEAA